MAYNPRRCLWFGTLEWMQWMPTPISGGDMSPESWTSEGTLVNGGGYSLNSWGSHKTYTFEWPESSSREVAMKMKSYADGTYGRGLIYFLDPLSYDKNILPARIADPSMACGNEGGSMVYGLDPSPVFTSGWQTHELPVYGAQYSLNSIPEGFRGVEDATFVPIPEGFTLYLGAFYTYSGSGGIFISPQNSNGTIGDPIRLTAKTPTDEHIITDSINGVPGVWLWLGKTEANNSSVTAQALVARLILTSALGNGDYGSGEYGSGVYGGITPTSVVRLQQGPWIGGMGHSGVRFSGKPTYAAMSAVEGGRISYAASFREVGSWAYG